MLIAARAVQGISGAVVSALAFSLIVVLFTQPAEREGDGRLWVRDGRRREHRRARQGTLTALTGGYHVAFAIGAVFAAGAAIIGGTFMRTRTSVAGAHQPQPALESA
jgi:MFS family permease